MRDSNTCPDCSKPLDEAFYTVDALHKTCTICSVIAGEHVYHELTAFGFRADREPVQCWCNHWRWSMQDKQSILLGGEILETQETRLCSDLRTAGRLFEDGPARSSEERIWLKLSDIVEAFRYEEYRYKEERRQRRENRQLSAWWNSWIRLWRRMAREEIRRMPVQERSSSNRPADPEALRLAEQNLATEVERRRQVQERVRAMRGLSREEIARMACAERVLGGAQP